MISKPIGSYIYFGTAFRYLQDAGPGSPMTGKGYILENIDVFLKSLEELNLHVTKRVSYDLIDFKGELIVKLEEHKKNTQNQQVLTLNFEEAGRLSQIMSDIRKTFLAESNGIFAYVTTDKRFEIKKLAEQMSSLFSPKVFDLLPEIAKYDFEEAGKCIVYERATASAFHILRGTEAVLKLYYKKYFRKSGDNKTWGQLLNELKTKSKGKKPTLTTINHLNNLRESFRNPTSHPEKIYDINETQDLLGICIDVINRMIIEIYR
jgi:hypothetical protein